MKQKKVILPAFIEEMGNRFEKGRLRLTFI